MEELLKEYFRLGDLLLNEATDLLDTDKPISANDLAKSKELSLIAATWYQAAKLLNLKLKELNTAPQGQQAV